MPSHDFPGLYHFHSFWFMVYHVLSMSQHSSMFSSTSIYCICLLSHPESAPRPDTHHIIRNASGLASSLGFSREAAAWLKFKSQDEFWSGNVWKLKCKQCNAQIDAERKRLFWTALQRATFGFVHVCVGLRACTTACHCPYREPNWQQMHPAIERYRKKSKAIRAIIDLSAK